METKKTRKPVIPPISETMLDDIERMATQGMLEIHIAAFFSIPEKTWVRITKSRPDVVERFERGKAIGIDIVTRQLLQLVTKGSMEAMKTYLKFFGRYSEPMAGTVVKDIENVNYKPVTINVTDPVEASKVYQQIMQGSTKK